MIDPSWTYLGDGNSNVNDAEGGNHYKRYRTPDGLEVWAHTDGRMEANTPDGGRIVQHPDGTSHSWMPGQQGWSTLWKNALQDKKFMGFLAIVGLGAAAAAYAAPAAGSVGAGGTTAAGAGAAPAVAPAAGTAPGITATQALSGATAVGGAVDAVGGGSGGSADPSMDSAGLSPYTPAPGADPSMDSADLAPGAEGGGWNQILDMARRAGQTVADFVGANPGIVSSVLGGVAGYMANKDPFTSSTTNTTTIDPAIAAQRDHVFGQVNHWAANPATYSPGGGSTPTGPGTTPGPANYGAPSMAPQQGNPMISGSSGGTSTRGHTPGGRLLAPFTNRMGSGGSSPVLGVQGGTAADFGAGGRWDQTGASNFLQGGGGSSNGMPNWSGSNAYMPAVQGMIGQGTAQLNATANPYATAENPYMTSMLDSAGKDMRNHYDQFIAPKFSSGSSFGNSGLGALEVSERDRQGDQFAQLIGNMRGQEYAMRSGLAEQGAGRQDDLNNNRRSNFMTGAQTFGNLASNAGQFDANFDMNRWQNEQAGMNQRMQALLDSMRGPGNTTNTTSTTAQGNPWLGAAAGGLAGANLWRGTQPPPQNQVF